MWGVSLTHPVLALILSGDFLLHIACWLLPFFFLSGEFLLHIQCSFLLLFYLESFSYTSRAGFIFMWGVSFTHPVPALILSGTFPALTHPMSLFLSGEFPLQTLFCNPGSFCYTSRAGFFSLTGVSLTHLVLASFLSGEFLLHIPYRLLF